MRALLPDHGIRLGLAASDRFDAVRQAGQVLVEIGAVEPPYIDSMLERERGISTSLGEGFAIPHGTEESRRYIKATMLSFLQFPAGVEWDDDRVVVAIGIAAVGDEHVGVLANLANVLTVPEQAARLRSAERIEDVLSLLGSGEEART
jgi:mannitol/fructose-specific phosphotransferase system IIA component